MNKVAKRMNKPTPRFFRKLRNIGLGMAAISTGVLAAPVALPAVVTQVAGYLAVAAMVASTVSQTAIKNERY
ncbi:hypothetical protein [Terrimonas pollutisoli]|uniref:hypothetical protein n=1 Tax=Terrimonas pollutisoli TaxID=3034147 RepID=UPI0023EB6421|nr:hypothetical protein [Terrimonas sp. H1YJ31]